MHSVLISTAGSLDQHLDKVGAFAELTVSNYTYQIICGVAYLHENRIIHRDLKGANVLVDQTGKRVLIADFGTAGTMKSSKTMTGFKDTKGTIPFMAPEVSTILLRICRNYSSIAELMSLTDLLMYLRVSYSSAADAPVMDYTLMHYVFYSFNR